MTHIGLGLPNPDPLLAQLSAGGIRVLVRGPDGSTVVGPGGLVVELVRDVGPGPDAFWCPMHPDVRSPQPGVCPRCNMALVPMPPPVFGDYRMRVDFTPASATRGRVTLHISDPKGKPVTSFVAVHERLLHVFILSRDLAFFDHVHPEVLPDGAFAVDVAFPKADAYSVYADFHPAGGTPQLLQTVVVSPDYRGNVFPPDARPEVDGDRTEAKTSGSLRVGLSVPPLRAGREQTLTFTLGDAASGRPVQDLQPYLGAAGHMFIVSADLTDAIHSHPTELGTTGPAVTFSATFPHPGIYKLWVQFQRGERVVTTPFVVEVR